MKSTARANRKTLDGKLDHLKSKLEEKMELDEMLQISLFSFYCIVKKMDQSYYS